MITADRGNLARALRSGPLKKSRPCQRRNLAKRLYTSGPRVRELRTRDYHLLRQAEYIDRIGRRAYDAVHTIDLRPDLYTRKDQIMSEIDLRSLQAGLAEHIPTAFVSALYDAEVVLSTPDGFHVVFMWQDSKIAVRHVEGVPVADVLTGLARVDRELRGAVANAFKRFGRANDLAEQITLARMGLVAGNGPQW